MTTPDFDALETLIRAEAEKKLAAAKTLAAARDTLMRARDEFAVTDAANVADYEKALASARSAGFTDKSLAEYNLATRAGAAKRTATSTRRKAGKAANRSTAAPSKAVTETSAAAAAAS